MIAQLPVQSSAQADHQHRRAMPDSVNSDAIVDGSVGTGELADNSVTAAKIATNAVGSDEIAADAVGSSELADNAVDTAAIADDAVTDAKIENDFARGIIAQFVGTGTNGPHTTTADTDMSRNNVPVVANHTYEIKLNCYVTATAAAGQWGANLKVNGSVVDRFSVFSQEAATSRRHPFNGTVYWVAPTTQATDDFLVQVEDLTATCDITLQGGATDRRTLTITDLGVL